MGKRRKKFSEQTFVTGQTLRIATPTIVADYRAQRLAGQIVADIGAGIGGQTFSFAKNAKTVFAVEKNEAAAELLRKNLAEREIKNVQIVVGDVFSDEVRSKLKSCDMFFCDPMRALEEQVRSLDSIEPSPEKLSKVFSPLAMELPAQLSPERVPFNAEKEYLSVNGRLNRLTVYFPPLKKCNVSVVSLPSQAKLTDSMPFSDFNQSDARDYIYEVDTAVVKANLLGQLCESLGPSVFLFGMDKYVLLTSSMLVQSAFIRPYRIYTRLALQKELINKALIKHRAKRVVIHARLSPEEHQNWQKDLQKGLHGSKTLHLFINGQIALLTTLEQ